MFGLKVRVDEFTELVPSGEHDPHPRDADGKTPLHYATEQGVAPAVMCLLDAGADPNVQETQWGKTPLSNAVYYVKKLGPDVAKRMVELGGDPTIVNYHGVSPSSLADKMENRPDVLRIRAVFDAATATLREQK